MDSPIREQLGRRFRAVRNGEVNARLRNGGPRRSRRIKPALSPVRLRERMKTLYSSDAAMIALLSSFAVGSVLALLRVRVVLRVAEDVWPARVSGRSLQ